MNAIINTICPQSNGGEGGVPSHGCVTYSSSDNFVPPENGRYTVVLSPGHQASGNGGSAGSGAYRRYGGSSNYMWSSAGGAGGQGGNALILTPTIIGIDLVASDAIPITINSSGISFGNYASIMFGAKAQDGGSGSSYDPVNSYASNPPGGSGGIGEGEPTISILDGITCSVKSMALNTNSSGVTGEQGQRADNLPVSVFDKYSGVAFGASATAGSVLPSSVIPGGKGAGSAPFCFSNTNYNITHNFPPLQQPESGAPEELGKIFIFW